MMFSDILGHEHLKDHLIRTAANGRIPHAQIFTGPEGSGTLAMAIAYAQYILCGNSGEENSGGNETCNMRFSSLSHPDLHFVFPSFATADVKKNPKSADFISDFRNFFLENPYGSLFEWYSALGVDNKQGMIRVEDAQDVLRMMSLKPYEGGYKVMIVWMAEKMNMETSNKLLKIIEEPPAKGLIILVVEDEEELLPTVRSRCQAIRFNRLPESAIAEALVSRENCDPLKARNIARQANGNFSKAKHLLREDDEERPFEEWFVLWVRAAFRAKGNAAAISELLSWSEHIAALGRESQKKFLNYCIEMFRQALLLNYQATTLVYVEPKIDKFKLENFAPFVNGNNIQEIFKELSDAAFHIERNGNAKIILTDLSIKLTRLIHKK